MSKSVETVSGLELAMSALVARLLQRPDRVHRGVVELDALADADRPGADDEHLLARERQRLVLLLVGAVEVRRHRLELGGAGIDHLVDGAHVPVLAQVAHLLRQPVRQRRDLHVGEAEALRVAQQLRRHRLAQQALLHAR